MGTVLVIFLLLFSCPLLSEEKRTSVQSESAQYNGKELLLKGKVIVEHSMGQLTAEKALLLRNENGQKTFEFSWLHLSDHVAFHLADGSFLTCQELSLDPAAKKAILEGKPQVFYRDERGELYANSAQVDYVEIEGSVKPSKIHLSGNVHMISYKNGMQKQIDQCQYALADQVDYFPQEDRLVFSATQGRRVLFFDPQKDLQLSAQTIYASRISQEGQETIQGSGDVRFIFKQDELENIKDRFKWSPEA